MARLLVCPKCGANVTPPAAMPGAAMECTYCGSTIELERPAPPPRIQIVVSGASDVGYARPASNAGAAATLSAVIVLIMVVMGGVVAFAMLRTTSGTSQVSGSSKGSPLLGQTKLPAECPMNGTLRIEDQTVTLKDTAITANVNCKLFFIRSKITAPKIVEGNTNVEITIEDSTLVAEDVVVDLNANGKVKVSGKSLLQSGGVGIKLNMNGEVRLEGGEIRADDAAVSCNLNGKLDAKNAKISGKPALFFSMNGQATLRSTEVKGKKDMGMNGVLKEK